MLSARSDFGHLNVDDTGSEAEEFVAKVLKTYHGPALSDLIAAMLNGDHPLQSISIHKLGPEFCTEDMKNYFRSLLQEAFLYYTTAMAINGSEVSEQRLKIHEEQIVAHENKYLDACGCPSNDMTLGNRGIKLSQIVKCKYMHFYILISIRI